jgi:hypothetical protein
VTGREVGHSPSLGSFPLRCFYLFDLNLARSSAGHATTMASTQRMCSRWWAASAATLHVLRVSAADDSSDVEPEFTVGDLDGDTGLSALHTAAIWAGLLVAGAAYYFLYARAGAVAAAATTTAGGGGAVATAAATAAATVDGDGEVYNILGWIVAVS